MKKGHFTFDVWAVVVDRMLDWRNKTEDEDVIKAIDHAMEGCRIIMATLPPPGVINLYLGSDAHVKLKWASELQDMVATYTKEGGEIEYVTTGGEG